MLFLELRKLERLAEGNDFEKEWLLEILREIVETIFIQISKNKENWATKDDNSTTEHSIMYKQVATYFLSCNFVQQLLFLCTFFSTPISMVLYFHSFKKFSFCYYACLLLQFVLDLQFLTEIAKYGGYFSNPSALIDLMKSAFLSADPIPER